MMQAGDYIPVLVCAVVVFLVLSANPQFLQGSKYGDKPKNRPDPLMTALVVLLIGAAVVYAMNMSGDMGMSGSEMY